jgi:hypothetical protein
MHRLQNRNARSAHSTLLQTADAESWSSRPSNLSYISSSRRTQDLNPTRWQKSWASRTSRQIAPQPQVVAVAPPTADGPHSTHFTHPAPFISPGPAFQYPNAQLSDGHAPVALNITHLDYEISAIHTDMLEATNELLESIGDGRESQMTLCPRAHPSAVELQIKCWGPHCWEVRSELIGSKLFAVPEVVMSLCSAYLLELFNREWSTCVIDCKFLETSARGRAILSLLAEGKWPMFF